MLYWRMRSHLAGRCWRDREEPQEEGMLTGTQDGVGVRERQARRGRLARSTFRTC